MSTCCASSCAGLLLLERIDVVNSVIDLNFVSRLTHGLTQGLNSETVFTRAQFVCESEKKM